MYLRLHPAIIGARRIFEILGKDTKFGDLKTLVNTVFHIFRNSGYISLLLPRLPKLPSQCYSNEPGNLGSPASNKEI